MKRYGWLLGINLFISAFTFGGGYVVVPMIRKYFVQRAGLFTEEELMDMAAVAQSSPGAIAINLSALAGWRVAGLPGVLVSAAAAVLPPLVILGIISQGYAAFAANAAVAAVLRGMQAAVTALMVDLVADMAAMVIKKRSWLLTVLVPAAFVASAVFSVNVALILLAGCALCVGQVAWRRRREAV